MPDDSASTFSVGLRRKRRALVLLIGTLALLFALAISITDLPLLPGEWFAVNLIPFTRPDGNIGGGEVIILLVRILLGLALVLLPINLILVIFMREARRRLLIHIATAAALWVLLNALMRVAGSLPENFIENAGQSGQRADGTPPLTPLPDFTPNPSEWAVVAAALAISLLIVGGLAGIIGWIIWRRRMRADDSLADLGRRAQAALDELDSGGDFRSAIIRCYRDMTQVLQRERGIQRELAMTPSEFAQALRGKGLPEEAVQQLTRTFEDVRYGSRPAGEREERLAKDSLAAIVAACAQARGTP